MFNSSVMRVGKPRMLLHDYHQLKQRQRAERENYPTNLSLRVHRALSWLHRGESCQNDLDGQFIFLWIAFNAAYAQDLECLNLSEAAAFSKFVSKICDLDQNKGLTNLVWDVYPSTTINMGDVIVVHIRML